MTPHQQRLTAAREAVVEAAKEWEAAMEEYHAGFTVTRVVNGAAALRAAVAALRAIEQETSNG